VVELRKLIRYHIILHHTVLKGATHFWKLLSRGGRPHQGGGLFEGGEPNFEKFLLFAKMTLKIAIFKKN